MWHFEWSILFLFIFKLNYIYAKMSVTTRKYLFLWVVVSLRKDASQAVVSQYIVQSVWWNLYGSILYGGTFFRAMLPPSPPSLPTLWLHFSLLFVLQRDEKALEVVVFSCLVLLRGMKRPRSFSPACLHFYSSINQSSVPFQYLPAVHYLFYVNLFHPYLFCLY